MAPEQALAESLDGRTDLYSLGCVGYYLLTGLMVFDHDNPTALVIDHVKTRPIPPSSRSGINIPKDLEDIIMNCLEKDPSRRPQSAGELSRGLLSCRDAGKWAQSEAREWWAENVIS
jgi:serine/threonine-protein kinase